MNEKPNDKMHAHKIDELFRSAVDPFEETPPAAVWESVEKNLDHYHVVNIKRKYTNLKRIAFVLVLLLSSTLMYELQQNNLPVNYNNGNKNALANNRKNVPGSLMNGEGKMAGDSAVVSAFADSDQTSGELKKEVDIVPGSAKRVPVEISTQKQAAITLFYGQGIRKTTSQFDNKFVRRDILQVDNNLLGEQGNNQELSASASVSPAALVAPGKISLKQSAGPLDILSLTVSLTGDKEVARTNKKPVLPSKRQSLFTLSSVFSPDFTSRRVKEDWLINREDNRDEIRKSERYAFSYSFGILADYNIHKNWAIESGFMLSRAVINIGPKFIFARPDGLGDMKYKFNSSSGYSFLSTKSMSTPVFGDSLHAFGSSSSLQYASIPLAVKYKFGRKKINFNTVAGIAANILVKDKIETSLMKGGNHENAINRNIKGLKPVYYDALIGVGAIYKINKTLAVSFSPTARFALTSLNKDAPVKSYQQSLGLVTGFQINL